MDRAHQIGGKGFDGICIRGAHKGLRCHVDDDVGFCGAQFAT